MVKKGNPNASRMRGAMPKRVNGVALPTATKKQAVKKVAKGKVAATKKTGTFKGKSNKLGHGGRAAQLKAKGVPQAVIGNIARAKGAAPGQKNYHGRR